MEQSEAEQNLDLGDPLSDIVEELELDHIQMDTAQYQLLMENVHTDVLDCSFNEDDEPFSKVDPPTSLDYLLADNSPGSSAEPALAPTYPVLRSALTTTHPLNSSRSVQQQESEASKSGSKSGDSGLEANQPDSEVRQLRSKVRQRRSQASGHGYAGETLGASTGSAKDATHLVACKAKPRTPSSRDARASLESKKPVVCAKCSKTFGRACNYERHSQSCQATYECETCGAIFKRRCDLRRHRVTHSEQKPYRCAVCGKMYSRKEHLTKHLAVHCKSSLSRGGSDGEISEREQSRISCATCGKLFRRPSELQSHSVLHLVAKPYGCTRCDRCFSWPSSLLRHMSTHGNSPVACCR